jgi:uncharacterized membrane protein
MQPIARIIKRHIKMPQPESSPTILKTEAELEKDAEERDFNFIAAEIKRQFDLILKADDALDTKTGILLGFIFLTIAQIALNKDLFSLITLNPAKVTVFYLGFLLLIVSIGAGIFAYLTREYEVGVNTEVLFKQFKEGEIRNYNMAIAGEMQNSLIANREKTEKKERYVKTMMVAFPIGLLIIALLELGSMSSLW